MSCLGLGHLGLRGGTRVRDGKHDLWEWEAPVGAVPGLEGRLRAGLTPGVEVRYGSKAGLKVELRGEIMAGLVCHGCVEWWREMKNLLYEGW